MTQKQAKILQQLNVLQQNVKVLPDAERVPVDGAASETADVVLAILVVLQDFPGKAFVVLPGPLDKNSSHCYITVVREPCLMPRVGWER